MKLAKSTESEFCEAMAHYIESLIAKRDFSGVIRYYQDNCNDIDNAGNITAGSILRNIAIAHASLHDYQIALKNIRLAQNLIVRDGDSIVLAETFMTLGGILRDSNELKEAEKAFRDAESIFRRNDSLDGQSRALNLLAGLFYRQNDFRNALSVLMDAVEIAEKTNDHKKLAFMMGNLGRIYSFTGNFKDAKKNLLINIDLSKELGDQLETARARMSYGYICIQEGSYKEADEILNKALKATISLKSGRDEVMCLTYMGESYYQQKLYEQSHITLNKALYLSEAISPDSTMTARIRRHLAELNIRQKNFRIAQRLTNKAMPVMKKHHVLVEIGALWKILAQIADENGDHDKTNSYFSKAFEMLDKSSVRFEKVDALKAAGCCQTFNTKKRLTYLFRAEEFYSGNNLVSKQNEVAKLIQDTDQEVSIYRSKSPNKNILPKKIDYISNNKEIKRFKSQLPLIGKSDIPILITGETGVGKDHMAKYFHSLVRSDRPFKAINCTSIPESLMESELFGFKKGAFTGAVADKEGHFVSADGGILFLDEIGDMPLLLQAKLLRVLEDRKVLPLGSTKEIEIDVVLVTATNQNLLQMVEEGKFRRDLYFRISAITFEIPPLRKRTEDIPLLLNYFMKHSKLFKEGEPLPSELVHQFIQYEWPGNIREMANKIKRLEIMSELVAEGDLVELSRTIFVSEEIEQPIGLFERVETFERKLIVEALLAARGNKSEAARILGIHEATVRTKLKRYGINLDRIH